MNLRLFLFWSKERVVEYLERGIKEKESVCSVHERQKHPLVGMSWVIYGFPKTEQNFAQSQALLQSLDLGVDLKIRKLISNFEYSQT